MQDLKKTVPSVGSDEWTSSEGESRGIQECSAGADTIQKPHKRCATAGQRPGLAFLARP